MLSLERIADVHLYHVYTSVCTTQVHTSMRKKKEREREGETVPHYCSEPGQI